MLAGSAGGQEAAAPPAVDADRFAGQTQLEMAYPSSAPDPQRLDALAAVTHEYATYSRTAYGLAFVATGTSILGAVAFEATTHSVWARFGMLALAPAWLLLLAAARAYYQRHGVVLEPGQRQKRRRVYLAWVWFVCAWQAALLVREAASARDDPWMTLATMLSVCAIVAVPLLTAEIACGKLDLVVTVLVLLLATALAPGAFDPPSVANVHGRSRAIMRTTFVLPVFATAGAALIVAGVRSHLRYRRLERRLAALKEGNP